ncbi:MAG: IS200/IS605 family transposase [Thermoplasmata archaeon]|nr:IS200/IS605 family transposase [Thermoplasmata archaeon]
MKAKQKGGRHTSSVLTDHLVYTTKFRAKVLVGKIAKDCDTMIRKTCKNMDVDVLELAVAEDHVHLFVQYPPEISPSRISEKVKSNSSRELREKYPQLVKWCKTGLWAPGCFHGSVGHGFDVVEQYIKGQQSFRKYG